jgi:hypothetical protein
MAADETSKRTDTESRALAEHGARHEFFGPGRGTLPPWSGAVRADCRAYYTMRDKAYGKAHYKADCVCRNGGRLRGP